MIKKDKKTKYPKFAEFCNENGLRIETWNGEFFGLKEDEMLLEGEVVSKENDEEYIAELKQQKIDELLVFDKSPEVNEFYIDDNPMWLDKSARIGIKFNLLDKYEGDVFKLYSNTLCYSLSPNVVKDVISKVEKYAKECFDVTSEHKIEIASLTTSKAIEEYNYKTKYPKKLKFEFNGNY